jgi:hypothetical protein
MANSVITLSCISFPSSPDDFTARNVSATYHEKSPHCCTGKSVCKGIVIVESRRAKGGTTNAQRFRQQVVSLHQTKGHPPQLVRRKKHQQILQIKQLIGSLL